MTKITKKGIQYTSLKAPKSLRIAEARTWNYSSSHMVIQLFTSSVRTLLRHVGRARVEDAHRPGELGAGQSRRA
jgi:hypothetical protein